MPTISEKMAAANADEPVQPEPNKAYPGWHDFVAGGVAGAGARMLTHPLDLVRIRRQLAVFQEEPATGGKKANRSMWGDIAHVVETEGGIRGLYRGNMAAIYLWVSYTAIQFYSYSFTKRYFQAVFPDESQRSLVAFCAGSSAGVAATLSSYPLDLTRTIFAARGATVELESSIAAVGERSTTTTTTPSGTTKTCTVNSTTSQPERGQHRFRPPKSTIEFATNLYKQRGLKGFYAGCSPTVIQIIPYMGCSFMIYDYLTNESRGVSVSAYAGSIAGAVSKTIVYPMDTVKKRLQAQSFFGSHDNLQGQVQRRYYTGIADCITTIYKQEGPLAFYNGLLPSVVKTAMAAGFSFAFFRSTKNLLESIHDKPFSSQDPPTAVSIQRRMTGH